MNQQPESEVINPKHKIGWIGTGRMGFAMAARLLDAGCDLAVFNRTRSKAEPLAAAGATIVDAPAELAGRDIVFTMVSGPHDLLEVVSGASGVLSAPARGTPQMLVDCSSVSEEGSLQVRSALKDRGCAMLSAPVSGNAKVVEAGMLTVAASGPADTFAVAAPYLELLGTGVTYVGEGEQARMVKICHNVLLGVVTQSLAEITVLARHLPENFRVGDLLEAAKDNSERSSQLAKLYIDRCFRLSAGEEVAATDLDAQIQLLKDQN